MNECLNPLHKTLNRLKEDLDSLEGVLLSEGYIVEVGTFPIRIRENQTYFCRAILADRFTQETAEKLASQIKDGNGEPGKAVYLRDSVKRDILFIEAALKEMGS